MISWLKIKSICALLIIAFIPQAAFANIKFVSGEIEYVRTHDGDEIPAWRPPVFWFSLQGVTEAGSCRTWNGTVLFTARDSAAYSMILGAFMAGKPVAVAYNENTRFAGAWCVVSYITLGNPPPLK
ncbi:hypothetical protein MEG05_01925 [Vibrio aestuarianus]|uniref:hypothetical protein n=1 Tax=Vibrio aestuarianus TaxID=28171 RepID=UPI00237CAD15|nr:hypothetical protein [Vibrio aestuarianus]MDE1310025.1 hypothetical protein [Vibrio aestuarianus]MDE1313076.1 hypothetical protein [Vibrio aestuarianus]